MIDLSAYLVQIRGEQVGPQQNVVSVTLQGHVQLCLALYIFLQSTLLFIIEYIINVCIY